MASEATKLATAEYDPLRIFTFVTQTEVWLIWLIYSLLVLLLMHVPGPYMMVWWIALGVPFLQFCLNLIESTAWGIQRAPPMTGDGFRDGRIYKQLLLSSALVSALIAVPDDYQFLASAAVLLVCPAMTAFVAMENSLSRALNPLAVTYFIWNMGLSYILLRLVVTTVMLYLLLLFEHHTTLLATFPGKLLFAVASVYLLLVLARSTGALLFSRRKELGIRTVTSQEQAQAAREESINRERQAFLGEMYRLDRAGKSRQAWEAIETRLKKDRFAQENLYYDDLSKWENPALAHKVAHGYLKRLVKSAPEIAWPILEQIDEQSDGNYRFDSGGVILEFARYATSHRQKRIIAGMLRHFDTDFPSHPRRREALLAGADLACQLDDLELAGELFEKVKRMRGPVHKPTFDRCRRLLAGP